MSLTVSPELLSQAQQGDVSDAEFVGCIKSSLPYAYGLINDLSTRLNDGETAEGVNFLYNKTEPPSDEARGQLLRAMASDSMRAALQRHFGIRLAFQNCHAVGVFPQGREADEQLQRFTSTRAQLLNQSPELVNC